jgi:hypothetical protein
VGRAPDGSATPEAVLGARFIDNHLRRQGQRRNGWINNVSDQISERVALRKDDAMEQLLGDKGAGAKVTIEGWPLGARYGSKAFSLYWALSLATSCGH